jgi:hypothetical protein
MQAGMSGATILMMVLEVILTNDSYRFAAPRDGLRQQGIGLFMGPGRYD